jgi:hypothetical protein
MRIPLLLVVCILVVGCSSESPEPEITRTEVERVLTTLAADDMEGRSAFGSAIERAADFIAGELEAAGLEPLPGAEGFWQSFPVSGFVVESLAVELDGQALGADRVLVRAGGPGVEWSGSDDVTVIRVPATEPPAGLMGALRGAPGDALVLVDEAHREVFEGVRPFLERPRFRTTPEPGPTQVFVLGSAAAETFSVRVSAAQETREMSNVVGTLPGRRTDEIVLFSAHYDHIGIQAPVDGDSIANGANDNASGTAAVISLARYFAAMGQPERTLLFAAFTAEEAGGLGSRYFSEQLAPDRIVAMFNIEMIGKPAVGGPNTAWITGFDRSDFGAILQRAVEGTEYSFYADPYPDQELFYRSDNATLARLGVPAHSISTTPIDVDTDYHRVSDEVSTLDLDHTTNTIRAIAAGAARIVSGEQTPTRVDPATVGERSRGGS